MLAYLKLASKLARRSFKDEIIRFQNEKFDPKNRTLIDLWDPSLTYSNSFKISYCT